MSWSRKVYEYLSDLLNELKHLQFWGFETFFFFYNSLVMEIHSLHSSIHPSRSSAALFSCLGASLATSHFLLLDDVPFILFILKCSFLPCKFIILNLTVNSSMNFEPCVIFLGSCSPVLSWSLLQHQHTPLHPLSDGHLPGRIWTELLCHLSWKHLH